MFKNYFDTVDLTLVLVSCELKEIRYLIKAIKTKQCKKRSCVTQKLILGPLLFIIDENKTELRGKDEMILNADDSSLETTISNGKTSRKKKQNSHQKQQSFRYSGCFSFLNFTSKTQSQLKMTKKSCGMFYILVVGEKKNKY